METVSPSPKLPELEKEILAFWKAERIFEKSIENRSQLSLVIMGGSRIPEWRRAAMPSFAAIVLFFGASCDRVWIEDARTFSEHGCSTLKDYVQ